MISPFTDTETITLKRKSTGGYTDGYYSDGAVTETEITASVQPMQGKELERIEINEREMEVKKVYTETELKTADTLVIDEKDFEVSTVEDFSRHGFLAHYYGVAMRRKDEGQRL